MSVQGQVDSILDQFSAPQAGPALAPQNPTYTIGSITYMLIFGAIAWAGGKIMESGFEYFMKPGSRKKRRSSGRRRPKRRNAAKRKSPEPEEEDDFEEEEEPEEDDSEE